MLDLLFILIIIIQAIVIYQDCKYRAIHVSLPLIILALGIVDAYFEKNSLQQILQISVYVSACLSVTYLYIVVKNKKWVNPFTNYLGIGDVFYFLAIIPFFSFFNYMFFFVSSIFFSIILFVVIKLLNKTFVTVPLAGFVSILFICAKIVQKLNFIDVFHGNF